MPVKFPPAARERLRDALVNRMFPRLDADPERAQTAAAKILKVDQSTISRVVGSGGGGSVQLAEKVAAFLNESPARILLGEDAPQVPRLRDLPGFPDALANAKERVAAEHPGLTPQDLEIAADTRAAPPPPRIHAGLLIHIALARQGAPAASGTQHKRPRRRT